MVAKRADKVMCPECGGAKLWRIGFWVSRQYGREQRYKCQTPTCGRTFLAHMGKKRPHKKKAA